MIYKLTTVKTVIYQIVTDLGIADDEIPVDDFIEWIGRALKHIGSYYQFTEKESDITIENYKGELPCDFYKMKRVLYNGAYLKNNNSLIGNSRSQIQNNSFTNIDYNITHNVITTAFETGTLKLQYLAIPVDCDGLPMVPDDVSFMDACFWRVVYQLSIRGYQFRNIRLRDIEYTKKMWREYCLQARAEANAPDIDMTERLMNNWLKFKPDLNQHYKMFSTLGSKERLTLGGANYYQGYFYNR